MEQKIKNTLSDPVAETLYIPLKMKCQQTRAKAPFYQDPYACVMVNKIDYDFSKYDNAINSSVGVAIRSGYYDQLTTTFIKQHEQPVVVVIGCGLDARYHRLGKVITAKAVFYEMDIPEVMALRGKLLPPANNDIYLRDSMFETAWMDRLKKDHPKADFLFIIEGVLMYFETGQVKQVLVNLAQRFKGSKLLFDVVSSWMCRNTDRHDSVKKTGARFKFGCDDDRLMERWAPNLRLVFSKGFTQFKEWKRIGLIKYWIMKFIPAIKNSSRLLYYAIDG